MGTERSKGKGIDRYFDDYASYHRTKGNQLTHQFGIPMIVVAVLGLLSHVSLVDPVNLGLLLWAGATIWYLTLDWKIAVPFAFVSLGAYFVGQVLTVAGLWAVFGLGWALQLYGHYYYEKRSPAFTKNGLHLLIGPLWIFAKLIRAS